MGCPNAERLNMGHLNVGVIGLGGIGAVYARNLAQRVPNARLAAVFGP